MYIPKHNRIEDRAAIAALIRRFSFGTLVTQGPGGLVATHLPFLFDPSAGLQGKLVAHMARANPQWKNFAQTEVLVIFQGEHGYISPTWYVNSPAVPTWNYQAVHAYGVPAIIAEPQRILGTMREIVEQYESADSSYRIDRLPEPYRDRMLAGIVAFEIELTRADAKSKLSQNMKSEDVLGAIKGLEESGRAESLRLAAAMRTTHGV